MFSTNEKKGELGFISKFLHKRGTILFPWLSTPTAIQQPLVILVGSIKVSLGGSYEWLAKSEEKSKSFYIFLSFFCNSWSIFSGQRGLSSVCFCNWTRNDKVALQRDASLKSFSCFCFTALTTAKYQLSSIIDFVITNHDKVDVFFSENFGNFKK